MTSLPTFRRGALILLTSTVTALATALAVPAAPASAATRPAGWGVFSHPLRVTNPYFPLVPGRQFTYRGTLRERGQSTAHTVTFTVTDLVKRIHGVDTVVVWDRDFLDGELAEQELAFFAQDDAGNVWNFGEYPEEYDAGRLTGAPNTWIRGTADAYGGIHVLGHAHVGSNWTEGRVESIGFWDVSRVVRLGASTCVPAGCYHQVEVVDERSPNDSSGGTQVKYYARGTGLVRVAALGGAARETLRLTAVTRLSAARLAVIDRAVRRMEARAYRIAAVYRGTAPLHPR